MRAPMLLLVMLALAGSSFRTGVPFDDGRPLYARPACGCQGKPSPRIGAVHATIVERPSPGHAVVEVRWGRDVRASGTRLVVALPEGAWLVRGARVASLSGPEMEGRTLLEVGFETDVSRDLVVCLEAQTPHGKRRIETYARLVTVK